MRNPDINKEINDNIKKCIFRHKVKMKDLAAALGVSQPTFFNYFRAEMPFFRVRMIADELGVTVDELTSGTEPVNNDVYITKCPQCGKYIQIETEIKHNVKCVN